MTRLRDEDFQPAIEAGIAQQEDEIQRIAENPDVPTFENTMIAMEKSRATPRPGHGSVQWNHGREYQRMKAEYDAILEQSARNDSI